MPTFQGKEYTNNFTIAAKCDNPASRRSWVGITFLRNSSVLEIGAANSAIENAQEKLAQCPPNCEYPCVLRNLAQSSPEKVIDIINSNPSQITDGS